VLGELDCPLLAVDEAHCIAEWGHDFRPVYRDIGTLLREMRPPRVLACTATATPIVRDEIVMRLGMPADTPQRIHGFARPNLTLRAFETVTKRDRTRRVDAALDEAIGKPSAPRGAAIIYATTRRAAEREAMRLQDIGWNAVCYHAGLSPGERTRAHEAFSSGEAEIVAATNAFGMGIDRADVRTVIHLSPPGSLEAYYQEVGRAGRDGKPSWGTLLTSTQDLPLRRRLLEMEIEGRAPDPAVIEHKWGLFLELMRWAEGGSCRHDAILRYFGDEAETLQGCGRCDVCRNMEELPASDSEEVQLLVRKALSGIARVHGRLGLIAAANLLKGKNDERLVRHGLQDVRTFGLLQDREHEWVVRLLRRCVTAGWVAFSGDEHPVVEITENGRQVMTGTRPGRLLLPSAAVTAPAGSGRAGREKKAVGELDARGTTIFEALRTWRLARARNEKIPPYVVASDRCLRDVATLRPTTMDELMLANGIGPARAERFGSDILEVVSQNAS
jgi:ATP-dependent DNA helicase RecQ